MYNFECYNLICFVAFSWVEFVKVKVRVAQMCPTLCNSIDYIVHGILQARILEWVAFPFCRRSSQPRDWTGVSCIAGGFFTNWAIREAWVELLVPFKWIQIIKFDCSLVLIFSRVLAGNETKLFRLDVVMTNDDMFPPFSLLRAANLCIKLWCILVLSRYQFHSLIREP